MSLHRNATKLSGRFSSNNINDYKESNNANAVTFSPSPSKKGHARQGSHFSTVSVTSKLSDALENVRKKLPFGFHLPLCCESFKLPSFRFSQKLEWRSQSKYESRAVALGPESQRRQVLDHVSLNPSRVQTRFSDNKVNTAKYTFVTFVPLNLFEQFRRGANFYFLCNLLLTVVLKDSPIDPMTWLASLVIIVSTTMTKQAYEDYLRHQSDREVNERLFRIVGPDGSLLSTRSQHLRVGDVVHLEEDDPVPCDLVVLSTSHPHSQCYVMTANLDGETSLKTKRAATLTKTKNSASDLAKFVGYVECENPNPKLDNFVGRLTDEDARTCSLTLDNLLVAGTMLKNTTEAFGLCVYSGEETKMSLNSKITRTKFSTIEKTLNRYLLFFVVILLTEMTVSTVFSLTLGHEYQSNSSQPETEICVSQLHWYLGLCLSANFKKGFNIFLVWLVLYSYIIPISMYVSIELQKFIASSFIPWDPQLYDEERDLPAKCNTSDINEELGLITHLFTDKTGTLTRNIMVFQKYVHDGEVLDRVDLSSATWGPFLMVMTLCHSVQVSGDYFAASSPDEKALLEACKEAGLVFAGSSEDGETRVIVKGEEKVFQKVAELEFDSFRKCMSVVVRDTSDGVIHVLTKGAETTVLPLCVGDADPIQRTALAVDSFASRGLRTLVLAHREMSEEELAVFHEELELAGQRLVSANRAKAIREAYKGVEQQLTVVGATGIEDRLQEDVVGTLASLREAGIISWMLTGDKKETALNLAHAAELIPSSHNALIDLCNVSSERDVALMLRDLSEEPYYTRNKKVCLVVDGKMVAHVMKSSSAEEKADFLSLCQRCMSVVACRLSPIQKSQLVRMIKEANSSYVTAAIGDGGNDVSMIQEAHVGLGILGLEGTAAAKSSDFAFAKFCHLKRALLVHGHWYYRRLAFLVQYSFYKNVATFTCQLFFAAYSNWSGQTLFDSIYLMMFNTLYSALPVLIYGLTEQNLPAEDLLYDPSLYRRHRGNRLMRKRQLVKWLVLGAWHSAVCFFIWLYVWPSLNPFEPDMAAFGSVVACSCVLVTNLKVLVESRHWNLVLVASVLLSVAAYVAVTLLAQAFVVRVLNNSDQLRAYLSVVFKLPTFEGTMIVTVLALAPDFAAHLIKPYTKEAESRRENRKTHPG